MDLSLKHELIRRDGGLVTITFTVDELKVLERIVSFVEHGVVLPVELQAQSVRDVAVRIAGKLRDALRGGVGG